MAWEIGIIIATFIFYTIPFLPGIVEYYLKTDALSLGVNVDKNTIDYRLRLFKSFLWRNFAARWIQAEKKLENSSGQISNGMSYQIVCDEGHLKALPAAEISIFCQDVYLPDGMNFQKVYGRRSLKTGNKNEIYSMYVENNLHIQSSTTIQNIVYSGNELTVDEGCNLFGFAKATKRVYLKNKVRFQCISAPVLVFGHHEYLLAECVKIPEISFREILVIHPEESFHFSEGKVYQNHYVFIKKIAIPDHCQIIGNIKCHEDVHIGKHVKIFGSIICEKSIEIDENSFILGPIVASRHIYFAKDVRVGTQHFPTSIISEFIQIDSAAVFFGTILARFTGNFQ